MPTLNPWVILGAVLTAIGLVFGGYAWGDSARNTAWLAKTEKDSRIAVEEALTLERQQQGVVNEAIRQQSANLASINTRLRADVISLRNRVERASAAGQSARSGCAGATGAELSRPDAEFLVGEAARADSIRAGLATCYQVIDGIQPR